MVVMRFPNGLAKAVTLSYDDGVEQDKKLMEILDQYGLRCTFNLNSGCWAPEGHRWPEGTIHRRMPRSEAVALYKDTPHEVAVHCLTHASLVELPIDQMIHEIKADRENLERDFGGIIRGFAYPYGTFSDTAVEALRACNIQYARTVMATHDFNIPQDWLRLAATCHHKDPMLDQLCDTFLSTYTSFRSCLFYLWGHSYEFEADNNWDVIERFARKMGGHDDIWYATNIEIVTYVNAFRQLVFSADGTRVHNPTALPLYMEAEGKPVCVQPGETVNL